jgi:hypothetical protein
MKMYKEKYASAEGGRPAPRDSRNGSSAEPRQVKTSATAAKTDPVFPNASPPNRKPGILDRLKSLLAGGKRVK